jgi:hypothetical protein
MDTTAPVSFSEFARHLGRAPSYVTKLRQAGRLVLTDDGKRVHVDASKQRIAATESGQPQHVAAREHHAQRRAQPAPPAGEAPPEADAPLVPGTRADWERREAAARAQLREIELAKTRGDLVETAAVHRAGSEAGGILRTTLENLADQLAPQLAEGDPEREQRIHAQLSEHVELLLTEISQKLDALARQPGAPSP